MNYKTLLRSILSLLLSISILFPVLAQQGSVEPGLAAALQNKLDQERTARNLKGLSASLIIPGQGVWRGVSGVSHASTPIDTAMVFGIGSITKSFVATVVLQLQQDSLLSLSDSIHNWLPSYPNINPNITIKQLLQQRSGIYNYTNNQAWGNAVNGNLTATWTADQILSNYILAPQFAPGASFGYSNTNYLLLGRIIEEVTDSAWWDVLRYRLLNPHQLPGVYAEQIEAATGNLPHHWQVVSGTPYDLSVYPRTAIWTSASSAGILASNSYDVALFAKMLFEGQVLNSPALAQMLQFTNAPGGSSFNGYGLGIMRMNNLGQTIWGHGGNIPGFAASMVYSPTDSISVSVLVNQDTDAMPLGIIMLRAAQQYLLVSAPQTITTSTIQLYPNPALQHVQVQISEEVKFGTLQLYSATGQQVLQQKLTNSRTPISVEALPKGIYFYRVVINKQSAAGKLVIE